MRGVEAKREAVHFRGKVKVVLTPWRQVGGPQAPADGPSSSPEASWEVGASLVGVS